MKEYFNERIEEVKVKAQVEILAPAGSMESMIAAINAGADAVYMGGSRFGARAYADNPEEDDFLKAIDYAHLHGCKLYMTVNTLVKESELEDLYAFLQPYYERGLDAVIVQDMGVFAFIREQFPNLPIHASTQMTVTSYRSAQMLKELGAERVVTARELSLEEIAAIRDHVDIEIESFVHGALCYCYSGQCLLSSLIGGRSGNRGRCAQPCRLPYEVKGQKADERYVLSLKDLCTLDLLPDIIEAGVYSLKIEGRMKSPRYTAGVVRIYRKYVDLYLKNGRKGYRVDPEDKQMLLDLFDRGGFTEGYYRKHNGKDMVALKEKPSFREGNQALFTYLDQEYVEKKRQEPVSGFVSVCEGEPLSLTLTLCDSEGNPTHHTVTVLGSEVQSAQNQPLSEDKLRKQLNKTGNSPFYFENLDAEIHGNCFLPVQALNELRRMGLEALEEEILSGYRREEAALTCVSEKDCASKMDTRGDRQLLHRTEQDASWKPRIHVSLEEESGFSSVVEHPDVDAVYLDAVGFPAESWAACVKRCHEQGKQCALLFPHIFRKEAENYFTTHREALQRAGFDELILRSLEEVVFLQELGIREIPLVFEANLYAMNHEAERMMFQAGASRLTLPLELNSKELEELGCQGKELVAYGHLPAMVSAQCVVRTTMGCKKQPQLIFMKDRTGKELPVKNHCRFCYNTIYNPSPLSLLGQEKLVRKLAPSVLRLSFTMETKQQMKELLNAYADQFRYGRNAEVVLKDFTRGHMKRGVE